MLDQNITTTVGIPAEFRKYKEITENWVLELKYSDDTIKEKLSAKEVPMEIIEALIQHGRTAAYEKRLKKGRNKIIIGAVFFVLGLGLTIAQIGFIFYGAIIFGIVDIIMGLIEYSDAKKSKIHLY